MSKSVKCEYGLLVIQLTCIGLWIISVKQIIGKALIIITIIIIDHFATVKLFSVWVCSLNTHHFQSYIHGSGDPFPLARVFLWMERVVTFQFQWVMRIIIFLLSHIPRGWQLLAWLFTILECGCHFLSCLEFCETSKRSPWRTLTFTLAPSVIPVHRGWHQKFYREFAVRNPSPRGEPRACISIKSF